jgi:hypothetical protein
MEAEPDGHVVGGVDADPSGAHQPVKRPPGHPEVGAELVQRHPERAPSQVDRSLEWARGKT